MIVGVGCLTLFFFISTRKHEKIPAFYVILDLKTYPIMELSHSLTLNEEALSQIPPAKRPVFIFEWLRFLDKVLLAAQKVSDFHSLMTLHYCFVCRYETERYQRMSKEISRATYEPHKGISRTTYKEINSQVSSHSFFCWRHLFTI